ncbi:MAG: hypothetical protein IH825_07730 [Candidatus Marinimicrobia bacterium]|nr:hypothetical protein [Candidatus Neomarinimicrobiota bacterium]
MSLTALLNPTVLLAVISAVSISGGLGYCHGVDTTENSIAADIAREEQLAQSLYDKMIFATASEISKIEIVNTTIRQELEREIRTEKVYLECTHPDHVVRLLNAILAGERPSESFSGIELPEINPAN